MKTTALRFCIATSLLVAGGCQAAGGLSVTREVTIDSTPATVWKLVGDFNALDVWHPAVLRSEINGVGTKIGTRRLLTLAENQKTIIEQLTAYTPAKTSYSYTIVKSPLPVANYAATISLTATAEGKTVMKWASTFDAPEGTESGYATQVIEGIYDSGLAKVVNNFAKQ